MMTYETASSDFHGNVIYDLADLSISDLVNISMDEDNYITEIVLDDLTLQFVYSPDKFLLKSLTIASAESSLTYTNLT